MLLRRIFNLLPWSFLALGGVLVVSGLYIPLLWVKFLVLVSGGLLVLLGLLFFWWFFRPNHAQVNPEYNIESWDVVNDEMHNSNTDLIYWRGCFYLVHAVSPFHFASTGCKLVLRRSSDAHTWETLAHFSSPGEDIRDPKLVVIKELLFLYALTNNSFDPEPYTTVYTFSEDGGVSWSPLTRLEHEGWLFWKPKTIDGQTWYAAAYWHEHGKSALYSTADGVLWEYVSTIYAQGHRNDETDIVFLPDGRMLSTARLEGDFKEGSYSMFFGHPTGATLITASKPPYTGFETLAISALTRLDGPALFSHNGRIFAVGRFQPDIGEPFTRMGSILARKRTAIFEVTGDRLVRLSDVPSAGDTAYAGVALHDSYLYFSYYTSPILRDYPWIVGMFNPTSIRMARVELDRLAA